MEFIFHCQPVTRSHINSTTASTTTIGTNAKVGIKNMPDNSTVTSTHTNVITKVRIINDKNQNENHEVSVGNFKKFQNMIYPIIHNIIAKQTHQYLKSIQKWIHVHKGAQKLDANSTFHTVMKALELKDLQDYRKFLLSIPGANCHFTMLDNQEASMDFLFIAKPMISATDNTEPDNLAITMNIADDLVLIPDDGMDSLTTIHTVKDGSTYKTCLGSKTNFADMLQDFWPQIMEFIDQNSDRDHTKQWLLWISNGLQPNTDMNLVK
jgi:hypothetical protein